jgi:transposase
MNFEDFYVGLLGVVEPWFVSRIEVADEVGDEQVLVHVRHRSDADWHCPGCGDQCPLHDHGRERSWRHLDTCQAKTFLVARLPRVRCAKCGVRQVEATWSEDSSRFTLAMESKIIRTVLRCQSVDGTAELMRADWGAVFGVMGRAVDRGLLRRSGVEARRIGIDEKAWKKGHSYHTLVYDLDAKCVLFVNEKRTIKSLKDYYDLLSDSDLENIEAVAMDMWEAYISATKQEVPGAEQKIVFDRFHVMSYATKAVDQVRRAEHKKLTAEGDRSLTHTRFDWLRRGGPKQWHRKKRFRELLGCELLTGQAWTIKEMLPRLWEYRSVTWARKYFDRWHELASTSGIAPMEKLAQFMARHIDNILTYCKHRITNAVAEGINSKIMSIKRQSSGFRNEENFKTTVYFHCGNLDLYPLNIP